MVLSYRLNTSGREVETPPQDDRLASLPASVPCLPGSPCLCVVNNRKLSLAGPTYGLITTFLAPSLSKTDGIGIVPGICKLSPNHNASADLPVFDLAECSLMESSPDPNLGPIRLEPAIGVPRQNYSDPTILDEEFKHPDDVLDLIRIVKYFSVHRSEAELDRFLKYQDVDGPHSIQTKR
ncbi:hypothetical protein ACHAPT_000405 [Fusarium lateritium]